MEREQIIKALNCCIKTQCANCCNLGDWHEQWNCMTNLMSKALSLIKELPEENEYLKQQNEIYAVLNEKMECICNSYVFQYGTVIPKEVFLKKEREKAVKEMQEMVYEFADDLNIIDAYIIKEMIDQIAKEMIGEGND